MTTPPVEGVSESIIRKIFNEGQFYDKVLSGEFSTIVKKSRAPKKLPGGEPPDTQSQIVYYYNSKNQPVAIVHQYLRPDGTIGASGLPDPKRVFLPDRIVYVSAVSPKDK